VKLLAVDLESTLPDIPPPTVGEQWVLVRLRGAPVGILKFANEGCGADTLARMIAERFAERIMRVECRASAFADDEHEHAVPELPRLTVAVCSRDGAARLPECLEALVGLDYPSDRLDLLLVDNAPKDESVRMLLRRSPSIRYMVEPRPGLNHARNRAIIESSSHVIAFTDDDVSVDPGWASAIGRLFASDPTIDAVTGLVVADEIDVEPQRLFEDYGGFSRGFERRYFKVDSVSGERAARHHGGSGRFGTGANMAFRRSLFDRIGMFDPALDVGTPTNGGGDLEMFFRVLKERGTLVYEPSAVVRHRHRRSYEELRTQLANNGIGLYSYFVRTARHYPEERAAITRLGASWFWSWSLRRLGRSFVRPSSFPRDLIVAELLGSIAGLRRYSRSVRLTTEGAQ
jgi:glycosyltransferase involved in cell wall biosynthesis